MDRINPANRLGAISGIPHAKAWFVTHAVRNLCGSSFIKMRKREYGLIASSLMEVIPDALIGRLCVMEYGCGHFIGSRSLAKLGELLLTDIHDHTLTELPPDVAFAVADIHHTGFADGQFDVLVSNQVLEYLHIPEAFAELKRIGTKEAFYAFAVPTSFWLIVSQPGNIIRSMGNLLSRMNRLFRGTIPAPPSPEEQSGTDEVPAGRRKLQRHHLLRGHGLNPGFLACLKSWRIRNWENLLVSNGFEIIKRSPLLSYSSSVLPVFPVNRWMARCGFSASYLFICRKPQT